MDRENDRVKEQYDRWPYPPVAGNNLNALAPYLQLYTVLGNFIPRFWPAGKPRDDMEILVAGCGTVAAACYAYNYPKCRVTGIDISGAALETEQGLKDRHKLENLTLRQCAIEDAETLEASFDYIACQGVLHHTNNPAEGLRILGSVLKQDGVMSLALYGKYPRQQVYAFQELFRLMRLDQTVESLAVVRETLGILSPHHPLHCYLRFAVDHQTDAGIADTYLHARDRSYSVGDCLALVADSGLIFQGWDMNFDYYPDGPLCGNGALCERLNALSDEDAWQAMEIISGCMRMHEFHVCRPDRDPRAYRIPWNSEKLLSCIPGHCVDLIQISQPGGAPGWAMGRGNLPPVPLTLEHTHLFSKMDGRRTVRECLVSAGVSGSDRELIAAISPLLRLLWRTGYGVLCIPGTR